MAVAYLQSASSGTNTATYTFPAQNLGAVDINRYIVVGTLARSADGNNDSLSSITVGGITASTAVEINDNGNHASISIVQVPTGSTGDVVVTFSDTQTNCEIALWRDIKVDNSAVPTDTGTSNAAPLTATMDVTKGFMVAVAKTDAAGTATWVGLDEDFDGADAESNRKSGASKTFLGGVSGTTITCTWTSSTRPVMAVASFELVPDATVSVNALTVNATINEPSVTGGANVTADVVTVNATTNDPVVTSASPDWRNQDKNTATITNQAKS